tara:strand:+ start:66 stop:980 length:915 start_codon:yes stop_codon:yes gene_type:complete
MAFKMKGSPFARNYGIGKESPLQRVNKKVDDQGRPIVSINPKAVVTPKPPKTKGTDYKAKSYKEAYKDADKSKYKTEADFVKAAKAYNLKTTGTTEVTKDAKALKTDRAGLVASKKKRDEVSVKKEVKKADLRSAELKTIKKVNLRPEKKKETTVANVDTSNVKERTKAGKLGVKVGNIFRKKGNKKTPGYKTVKNTDHNTVDPSKSDADKLEGTIKHRNAQGKVVTKVKSKKTGEFSGRNVYNKTTARDDRGRKTSTTTSKLTKGGKIKTTTRNKKGTLLGRILKGTNKKVVTRNLNYKSLRE